MMNKEQKLIQKVIKDINPSNFDTRYEFILHGAKVLLVSGVLDYCSNDNTYDPIQCIKELFKFDKETLSICINMTTKTSIKYKFKNQKFLKELNKLIILL